MGTCSSIYIEFRKRSDKQWHLLEAVVPLDYRDWRWGKSWCTLTELQSYLDERLEKCKASILREHAKQLSYGVSDKLDAILAVVSGKAMKPVKEEDEEDIDRGEHLIIKVPFYVRRDGCDVKLPRDYGYDNSPFCVRDINAGAVAWIFARGLERKNIDGIAIQAGVNPYEFFERVDRINEMYPYVPEED